MSEHRFNVSAHSYEAHAVAQRRLMQAVLMALPAIPPSHILELGAGTGLLTRALLDRYPAACIDAVDVAPNMVDYARRTFQGERRVSWQTGDAQTVKLGRRYPLIVSNAALQWVADQSCTWRNIAAHLEPVGWLVAGVMLRDTLCELRALRQQIAPDKVGCFQLPTAGDIRRAVEQAGLEWEKWAPLRFTLRYDDVDHFLRVIHAQGVTGGQPAQGYAPLTRGELRTLKAAYQQQFSKDGKVYATYDAVVLRARRSGGGGGI